MNAHRGACVSSRRLAKTLLLGAAGAWLSTALASGVHAHQAAVSTRFDRWSWRGADAAEIFTQLQVGFEVTPQILVDLASGHARVSGERIEALSGLVDSRANVTYRRDALIVRLGINAPTGRTKLNDAEATTAGVLADRVLALPSSILGRGTDVDLTGAYAVKLEDVVLGFNGGYVLRSSFTPFDGTRYAPGDRLSLGAAAELGTSRWKWRSTATLRYTFADRLGGEDYVRNGLGFSIGSLALKRWVEWSLWARLDYQDFGDPDVYVPGATARDFAGRSRRDVAFLVGSRTHLSARGSLDASVGVRILSGAAFVDGARRVDLEVGYAHRLSPRLRGAIGASLSTARLDDVSLPLGAPEGTDLTGVGLSLEVRSSF